MATSPVARVVAIPSADEPSPTVRREQSERELRRVKASIGNWFADRQAAPGAELHKTRLQALKEVLDAGVASLATALANVDASSERLAADVNADCREIDQAVVWMHRVWTYYREKFDQRADPALAPTLAAADEVIWSCYQQVFLAGRVPPGVRIGPAPLGYIESEYSPATWEATKQAPSNLREAIDIEGLEAFLATLPIPTLRLPPWCIDAPWWLVFIAHEVGHSIQRELGLVAPFRGAITAAWPASDPQGSARSQRWARWDTEIFADLASVATIGAWAIEGLRELVLSPPEEMARATGAYPSPIVRLTLMARAADRLGMGGTSAIASIDPAALTATPEVIADLADVDRVLEGALGPLGDTKATLAQICATEAVKAELPTEARAWAGDLPNGPGVPAPGVLTPRYVLCGTFLAWQRTAGLAGAADRLAALDALAANANTALASNGPAGTRAGSETVPLTSHGEALADWLLAKSRALRAGGTTD
jgi:hypothetical protein